MHVYVEPPRRGHFGILPLSLVERLSLSQRLFCIKSINPCISEFTLLGGCPLLGGSVNRGSTVCSMYVFTCRYMYECMYTYVCMHVCVCMYVYVCM